MRIRKRPADAPPGEQAPSAPPRAPPPSTPRSPAPSCRPETADDRQAGEQSPLGADRAAHFHLLWSSASEKRPAEEEESGTSNGDEKIGREVEIPENKRGNPPVVNVVRSDLAASARIWNQRNTEAQEQKSENVETAPAGTCRKADGKGWHCKRAAQMGYSLCQYHLELRRSHIRFSRSRKIKKKSIAALSSAKSTAPGQEAPPQKKKKIDDNRKMEARVDGMRPVTSDSFYYYSGFGPWWTKRRSAPPADADGGAFPRLPHSSGAAADREADDDDDDDDDDGAGQYQRDSDGVGGEGGPMWSKALSSLL